MFQLRPLALSLLLLAPLLTSCGQPPQVVVQTTVPPTLLECQAEPVPPRPFQNDTEFAYWMVDLTQAGRDCRDKLDRVKSLLQKEQQ